MYAKAQNTAITYSGYLPKPDTVSVMIGYVDTCWQQVDCVAGGITGTHTRYIECFYIDSIHQIKGYEVRRRSRNIPIGWDASDNFLYDHIKYLDEYKMPFKKSVKVWAIK